MSPGVRDRGFDRSDAGGGVDSIVGDRVGDGVGVGVHAFLHLSYRCQIDSLINLLSGWGSGRDRCGVICRCSCQVFTCHVTTVFTVVL